MMELAVILAATVGSAAAAGMSGFRIARRRSESQGRATYVRLSAEDSDRVEKIEALLQRLIGLEEQTRTAVERLAEKVVEARLDEARREGFLRGKLDALGGPGR
jgi:hypothetical protein